MSKQVQITILSSLLFLVLVLIGFNFALDRYGVFWQKEKQIPKPISKFSASSFSSPVKTEHLETTPSYAIDSDHLVFFLPAKTPVYALVGGRVSYVGQKITAGKVEFENIILKKENEETVISYLLAGGSEILVKKDNFVLKGAEIAKTSQEKGPGCLGGANLGVYLFENDKPAKLTKEMLQ